MDRKQAFTEYRDLLDDSSDWLAHGYRREHNADEIIIPVPKQSTGELPVETPSAVPENNAPVSSPISFQPPPVAAAAPDPAAVAGLKEISGEIAACRDCNLYLIRQNTVPGIGSIGATLFVVSPPPADGAGENDSPLASYEQEYLAKWLSALNLTPGTDTFITPAVKCRTPGGRPPHPDESGACSGYLRRQYKDIRPKAILALGAAACGALTGNSADFPTLVGRDWTWGSVPALVLWTPAEVLANPGRLRKPVWDSLQRLKAAWNAVPGSSL